MTPYIALITLLTVVLMMVTAMLVGKARGKYSVQAPATTGHPDFERAYRVQANTLEAAVAFLPALWVAGSYSSSTIAALLGVVWLLGRVLYMTAYLKAAEKRGPGFVISFLALLGLLGLAVWGVAVVLIV
ncbi:MAG: MAPEG family protein [Xanthomonadaceae bacterium]|nr:MAPEG family protein [Xanthomonadaceae bacterium]MDZ4114472.1 MAPEG family protein [Xanthomonadaceae bacterium]MDZ4378462.1 MAPEG family protein [Xanthomonadaceae bacterium]